MTLRDFVYYEENGITLYCGDCRDVLPLLDAVADVVVTDPPYGETALAWDVTVREWVTPARRAMRPAGTLWCFGSLRAFMRTAAEWRDWHMAQDIVWEKHNGSGFASDRFKRVHEYAVQFYPDSVTWAEVYKNPPRVRRTGPRKTIRKRGPTKHTGDIGPGHYEDSGERLARSVLYVRSEHAHADHPTQKPIGIIRPLVEYSCPDRGLVLDPFSGSGTTLVTAKLLGRRAIGIEIEERYCAIAKRRLAQGVLFGAPASDRVREGGPA